MECISGIVNVIHSHIGLLQYEGRTSKSLADAGVFFYDHFYKLGKNLGSGSLVRVPLEADWTSIDWPVPDALILEAVKSKLFKDIQRCLRPTVPTKIVKISMFLPLTVFVEVFCSQQVRITKSMLLCKALPNEFCESLLDPGWHTKEADGILSEVCFSSLIGKYMIASQSMLLSFWYKRSHYINGVLVPMDQEAASLDNNQVMEIEVLEGSNLLTVVSLREQSTLEQLRLDILEESLQDINPNFSFIYKGRKLLRRRERTIQCMGIPKQVQIVQN